MKTRTKKSPSDDSRQYLAACGELMLYTRERAEEALEAAEQFDRAARLVLESGSLRLIRQLARTFKGRRGAIARLVPAWPKWAMEVARRDREAGANEKRPKPPAKRVYTLPTGPGTVRKCVARQTATAARHVKHGQRIVRA